jgi:hypothetical protein
VPDFEQDPMEELAGELRMGAGAEFLRDAEITERETHLGRLRRLTLADVVRRAGERGDQVSYMPGDRTVNGVIIHAGTDYATIETESEWVDVRLTTGAFVIDPRPSGGIDIRGGARTMKARLAEFEQTGESVELIAPGLEVRGVIVVAAADHVVVDRLDGTTVVVPSERIEMIVRPRPPR